jgi:chromosome partitioning protein
MKSVSQSSPSRGRAGSIFGRFRGNASGTDTGAELAESDPPTHSPADAQPNSANGGAISGATKAADVDAEKDLAVPGTQVPQPDESEGSSANAAIATANPISEGGANTAALHEDVEADGTPAGAPAATTGGGTKGVRELEEVGEREGVVQSHPNPASGVQEEGPEPDIGQPPGSVSESSVTADEASLRTDSEVEQSAKPEMAAALPEADGKHIHPGPLNHSLPRCLAVANQKGGVGKTTTAVNLGAALAELGYRVLVVDLDPQGNATTGLGVNARNLDSSVYDVILHDVPIEDVIEPTTIRNLFVVPATIDLAGAEIELVPAFSRELRLKRALETVQSDFDFIIIDCPPSLGLLTVNALAAAREVIVPIQCEYYALEGLGQLLRNVGMVQSNLNNDLEVSTIILTMYDARTKLAEQVAEDVREHFGDRVCRNVVPRTVRLSEAPSFGQPIIIFDPTSRGAIAYRELAKEVGGGAPQRVG